MLDDIVKFPNKTNWAVHVKTILSNMGFYHVWLAQGVGDYSSFMSSMKQRIRDVFVQNLNSRLSDSSRALFYRNISKFEFKSYLKCVNVQKFRIALSQLRLSSHRLNIEVGRWNNTVFEQRICPHCNVLEDEFHFLIECSLYTNIRCKYIPRFYRTHTNMYKTIALLNTENTGLLKNLSTFVYNAFAQRKLFITMHT